MYYELVYALRMVKFFYDIGVYEQAVGNIRSIGEGDYLELFLRGVEHVATIFDIEELGAEVCCGGHTLYHFSDPALLEYYRLCSLYEHKYSLTPEENPYHKKADDYFTRSCNNVSSHFWAGYDDDRHPREIRFETCPDYPFYENEFLVLVYDIMEYYRREVVTLQNELSRGPAVLLPALPAPKRRRRKRRRPELNKTLQKAS
jgi:hypothetical protein